VGGLVKFKRDWMNEGGYVGTALVLNGLLRFWFANEAARQLTEERRAGTLELLLSTPLEVRDILRGQWLALVRQFLGPVLLVLVVEWLLMFVVVSSALNEDRALWVSLWLGEMAMLLADLAALYWLCQWLALTARNPARAAGSSLAAVLFLSWGAYALVMLVVVLASVNSPQAPNPGWAFFVGLWFGLGMLADLGFGVWARQKLLAQFRVVAQQRYAPRASFWKRWFG
jgi:ABC-type Na+ efflux pump permease subunit